ncbi:unnamed protein product [Ectocarpus sp. CCAP 1310/34]|nr:unnamed protein product [Ectocarpus sp. CCAP 1310/34]
MESMMTEKLGTVMEALSRLVPETASAASMAAAGGRGESRGGRHAPPNAGRVDQAPIIGQGLEGERGLPDTAPQGPTLPSAGDVSRESETSDPPARCDPTMKARIPRLKQLNFDGLEKNWVMFKNDFMTQVQTCGMMHALNDGRDIEIQGMDDDGMIEQGVAVEEVYVYRDLCGMLGGAISDETTKLMVYNSKGPSAAWRALEQTFTPLTGGEQISLIGKFYTDKRETRILEFPSNSSSLP